MGGETVDPGPKAETPPPGAKTEQLPSNSNAESATQSSSQPPPGAQATEAESPRGRPTVAKGHQPALVVSGSQHKDHSPFPQQASSPHPEMPPAPRTPLHHPTTMAVARPQGPHQAEPHRYGGPMVSSPAVVPNTRGTFPIQNYPGDQRAAPGQFYPQSYPMHFQHPPSVGPPLRLDLNYYQNPPGMNQTPYPAAPYYYAPGHQLPMPTMYVQAQTVAGHHQYGMPTAPQLPVPSQRYHSPAYETAPRVPLTQNYTPPPPTSQTNGWPGDVVGSPRNVIRGPPRKPRQTGHAVWIGNLPPQASLMDLVDHVCKETEGLDSLFLISKSNCAFANFQNETSCLAALRKLHDSRFLTVRLVCRLRKSTVEGLAGAVAPTGPASSAPQAVGGPQPTTVHDSSDNTDGDEESDAVAAPPSTVAPETEAAALSTNGRTTQTERFFVLKSLTVEDLELSVRTKLWATQAHNEEALNSAFQTADNVYLVFSANKSGEYFGYARMASAINDDPAAAIAFSPGAQSAGEEPAEATVTEPTEFAPRGRIINDSARGTMFWEKYSAEKAGSASGQDNEGSECSVGDDTASIPSGRSSTTCEPKVWGKPFRLEWLSTARFPFYRTRGLRNPWNSNREVKIARDGTELEPSVGRLLIGMFNRNRGSAFGASPPTLPPSAPGMPPPMPPGW